jgi:aryl-alcohol dehydrogenase-like predicted oxidoreductase
VFFGTKAPEAEAFKIMDAYVEAGGNWIDTARVYCTALIPPEQHKPGFLDSEETIGRWLKQRGNRDKMTVITKGAHWSLETKELRVKPDCIRHDIDVSLKNLGVEQADIYFLHNDDPSVPVEEIMPVMDELKRQGKIKIAGCSNWKIGRIKEANAFAEANGLTPFAISQVKWSYAAHTAEAPAGSVDIDAEYAEYKKMGLPVMAYSSQARGFFIKAAKAGLTAESLGSAAKFVSPQNERRAAAVLELAKQEGISPAAAAFAYLWTRDIPVTALVGPDRADQLAGSLENRDYIPTAQAKAMLEAAL